jgi:hypothetical protein
MPGADYSPVWRDVPAAIPVVGPRITDIAALESPLQPAQPVVGDMLQQLDRRPARRQPAAPLLCVGQRRDVGDQPGPEELEVAEEDLGPGRHWNGGLRERQAHKDKPASSRQENQPHPVRWQHRAARAAFEVLAHAC